MKRYQVYLNPQSIEIIDLFAEEAEIPRSRIIRNAIDSLANNLSKALVTKRKVKTKGPLDELIGLIKPKGKQLTDFASTVDEIYLTD